MAIRERMVTNPTLTGYILPGFLHPGLFGEVRFTCFVEIKCKSAAKHV